MYGQSEHHGSGYDDYLGCLWIYINLGGIAMPFLYKSRGSGFGVPEFTCKLEAGQTACTSEIMCMEAVS